MGNLFRKLLIKASRINTVTLIIMWSLTAITLIRIFTGPLESLDNGSLKSGIAGFFILVIIVSLSYLVVSAVVRAIKKEVQLNKSV